MENLQRKSRMVSGGHINYVPPNITYKSVVSCEAMIIALKMEALNSMIVKTSDIMHTYIK